MSYVFAVPDEFSLAATSLANIGSTINEANTAAALPTTNVLAAGADEVSTAVAAVFGSHALDYQALNAQASAFHQQFVQALKAGAGAYASAEAAHAAAMANPWQVLQQDVLKVINAPTEALLQSPTDRQRHQRRARHRARRWGRWDLVGQWRQRRIRRG